MLDLPIMTFHITETQGDLDSTAECYLDGKYEVISRSGLSRTEAHLIEAIHLLPPKAERLLVLGNRTGAIAMIATHLHPGHRGTEEGRKGWGQ